MVKSQITVLHNGNYVILQSVRFNPQLPAAASQVPDQMAAWMMPNLPLTCSGSHQHGSSSHQHGSSMAAAAISMAVADINTAGAWQQHPSTRQ